jgi:hypothetical protein
MCSACGLLRSGVEWIEGVTGDENFPDRRLAERRRRITLINMLLEGSGVKAHGARAAIDRARSDRLHSPGH